MQHWTLCLQNMKHLSNSLLIDLFLAMYPSVRVRAASKMSSSHKLGNEYMGKRIRRKYVGLAD